MNYLRLLLLLFVMGFGMVSCTKKYANYKESSQFSIPEESAFTPRQCENIARLIEVWGYAKYHHPVFATSARKADYEFFELLPKMLDADSAQCDELLFQWIRDLGTYRTTNYDTSSIISDCRFDETYIYQQYGEASPLSEALKNLRYAKRKRYNQYIQQTRNNFKLVEKSYDKVDTNDMGYQLLGVARFVAVETWFAPNAPEVRGADSLGLHRAIHRLLADELIPAVGNRQYPYYELFDRMITAFRDVHVQSFLKKQFGPVIIPIQAQFFNLPDEGWQLIVTHPTTWGGHDFQLGDRILDSNFAQFIETYSQCCPLPIHRNAGYCYLQGRDTIASLTYLHDGNIIHVTDSAKPFVLYTDSIIDWIYYPPRPAAQRLHNGVGYINISATGRDNCDSVWNVVKRCPKLILDFRGYPGDFTLRDRFFSRYLLQKPTTFARLLKPNVALPGTYLDVPYQIASAEQPYKGKIVLLVNENTQSMAELFVMLMQSNNNVTTIGSPTAGADGDVVEVMLPFKFKTYITGTGVLYPDGSKTQNRGVRIDIPVHETLEGILQGRDEILEAALKMLQ